MRRSAIVAFCLVTGFLTLISPPAFALELTAGETLGGHIRILSASECRDLHIDSQGEVSDAKTPDTDSDTQADQAQPPPPPTDNLTPKDLNKKSFAFGLFNFKPDGAPKRLRTEGCSADHLQELIFANHEIGAQSSAISKFFETCHTTIKRQGTGDLGSLLQTSSSIYKSCENPRIHAVEVSMDDGTKLRGLLALQDSARPLPFLIFKDGAFGNSNSASSRMALMSMFDQAPINMLVLGNVTGSDYLRDNQHIALGGFDEGMQVIEVAKMLRKSELAPRISEINVMGVSLGGQAALFASYFNSWQPKVNSAAPVTSIFAMSPVVNLESSMNSLFSPGVKWKVVRKFLLGDFFGILGSIPFLSGTLHQMQDAADDSAMPGIIATGAVGYYSKVQPNWGLAPYTGLKIQTPSELWSRNNFLPMAAMPLTTPTLVLGAQSDWVVEPEQNSLALKDALEENGNKSAIKVVMLDRGNHCAFGPSIGWDLYSAFLTAFEISRSPALMARRHFETAPIDDSYLKKIGKLEDDEQTVAYRFAFSKKNDYMKITVDQIDDEHADDQFCDLDAEQLGDDCLKRSVVKIPLSDLPSWARQPINDADAQALTRWANANVRLVSDDGTTIGLNNKNPAVLKWVSFE